MNRWDGLYGANRFGSGIAHDFTRLIQGSVRPGARVLELGCGTGVNIPTMMNMNANYWGIDGSSVAIEQATTKFPSLSGRFTHGDFTEYIGANQYDVICERASVAHNDTESVRRCIKLIASRLVSGGLFVSGDWFSAQHSEFRRGVSVDDNTRRDYPDGQFLGAGTVHFSSEAELRELFSGWECLLLIERLTRYVRPPDGAHWVSKVGEGVYTSAVWDMIFRKP